MREIEDTQRSSVGERARDGRRADGDVRPMPLASAAVSVDAVVYFNVIEAEQALCSVDDFR